jgi:hypothetical protein
MRKRKPRGKKETHLAALSITNYIDCGLPRLIPASTSPLIMELDDVVAGQLGDVPMLFDIGLSTAFRYIRYL